MPTALNRGLGLPLYHQLKAVLLEEIRSGRLKPEDRLPNEDQLAAEFGVSIITVRRALSDLASAGYVRREQGRGTFIARPTVVQGPRQLTSFSYEMARRGLRATSRILLRDVIPATPELAEGLRVLKGAEVFRLRRLRLADGEPMGIQTAHIPLFMAPALVQENFAAVSLYEFLNRKCGIVPSHAREVHSAILLRGEDAQILQLAEGSPGLSARRVTYCADSRPFELVDSVMRGDRYQIVLDLVAGRKGR